MTSVNDGDTQPNSVRWNTDSPAINSNIGYDGRNAAERSTSDRPTSESRSSHEMEPQLAEPDKIESDKETPETSGEIKNVVSAAKKKFHLHRVHATGPSKRLNPTSVHMHVRWHDDDNGSNETNEPATDSAASKELALLWRSRDNRKGRGSVAIPNSAYPIPHNSPPMTLNLEHLAKGIVRMFTTFPYWDMAFWSGWSYSVGSVMFVMDGAFAWGPIAFPSTDLGAGEEKYAVPLLFFFGALFYQVGATMAYLEAVNDGSFAGSALKRFLDDDEHTKKDLLDEKLHSFFGHLVPHRHHGQNDEKAEETVDPEAGWRSKDTRARPGSIYPDSKHPAPRRGGLDLGEVEEGEAGEYLTWRWWPTWHRLRTHHIYETGYLACTIQLFGATLYGITGVVVLPGILDSLSQWQENAAYWIPQIVASTCFLSAGVLFTIETQEKWYLPKYKDLGWWIGFWAIIGSMGFL